MPSKQTAHEDRATHRRTVLVLCALGFLLTACATVRNSREANELPRLSHVRQWLIDDQGRTVLMRGGNIHALNEGDSANPSARADLWRDDTPPLMAQAGFNGVRLVMHLSDLMPAPGRIDQEHLQTIERTIAAYREAGIYTLLDFHQDEYGPAVGVRGLPEWATFPDGHTRNRAVTFPNGYFKEAAVQRAFDNFWANHLVPGTNKGVQDHYVEGLVAAAGRFAADSAVFGIDVMNEPATGTPCAQPDPTSANCPELEQTLLKPFYEKAGRALTAIAPQMLIFVEPFMLQGALGIPINTPMPPTAGRRGLSYHNYGPIKEFRDRTNDSALSHAIAADAALLNTEWGFTNDAAELSRQAQDFDDRLISWLAWARGPFEELVNADVRAKQDETLDTVLRAYARPYPSATAGTPTQLKFDPDAGVFEFSYSTTGPQGARFSSNVLTETRIPAVNFPQGYTATVRNGRVVSTANAPVLLIAASAGATVVDVRVTRVGDLPPLLTTSATLTTRSLLSDLLRNAQSAAVLRRHLPRLLDSPQLGLSTQTSLRAMQAYDHGLTDTLLEQIDKELAQLKPEVSAPTMSSAAQEMLRKWPKPARPLSVDHKIGDLLADADGRAVMERWLPDLVSSDQLSYALDRTLRSVQSFMPALTDETLTRINAELAAIGGPK